jgi:hypothetical protein
MLAAALAVAPYSGAARAEVYVFPQSGIRVETESDERLIAAQTLDGQSLWLAGLGIDADALAASHYAERVLFEIITEDGVRVTLSERDRPSLGADDRSSLEPLAAFADWFEWIDGDWLRIANAYESIYQMRDAAIRSGALIELTARAPLSAGIDAAREALESVKERVRFIDKRPLEPDSPSEYAPSPLTGIARRIESSGIAPLAITDLPAWTDDGRISIKGETEPGAHITIMVDGLSLANAKADADGSFALEITIEGENGERRVEIISERGGSSARSAYTVLLARGVTPLMIEPSVYPVTDAFDLYVYTLPDASIELTTPSRSMRGPANGSGFLYFSLSIRRGQSADYTATASAPGLAPASARITLERTLSEQESIQDFRANARSIPYDRLAGDEPGAAGRYVELRGLIGAVEEHDGLPALVLYTSNPGMGSWRDPVYIYCDRTLRFEQGDVLTVLAVTRGETALVSGEALPALDAMHYLR